VPTSEPQLARYNPPWSIPFLRRNEVMFDYWATDKRRRHLPPRYFVG
jgi:hypothetical protein